VLGIVEPLKVTVEAEVNPFPFTVTVVMPVPVGSPIGEILEIAGAPLAATVRYIVFEVPDPLFETDTGNVPVDAIDVAGTETVSWFPAMLFAAKTEPLMFTVAPDTNPLPLTVMVNAPVPTFTVEGERLVIVGTVWAKAASGAMAATTATAAIMLVSLLVFIG
jgi:hypothetical protein